MTSGRRRRTHRRGAVSCGGRADGLPPAAGLAPRPTLSPAIAPSGAPRWVAEDLVGREMPSVVLDRYDGLALNLGQFAQGFPLVVYMYPAVGPFGESAENTAPIDAVQHQAFRDHQPDLEVRGYRVIGIGSQRPESLGREIFENRLSHMLLSDRQLQLADDLGLPTVIVAGRPRYLRLTLVVTRGHIEKVFFPVASAPRSAAQVIAWIKVQGLS